MLRLLALNPLQTVDKWFFIVCAAIIAIIVIVYFLIPVFNKKQYKEQRDNLKKREIAFKSNVQRTDGMVATQDVPAEPQESSQKNDEDGAAD